MIHKKPRTNYANLAASAMAGKLLAVIILIILGTGFGCEEVNHRDRWVTIEGAVIDRLSQPPIDSAWVALHDTLNVEYFSYSDTMGHFSVTTLPFKPMDLFAGKAGYRTAVDSFENVREDIDGILMELEKIEQP